MKEIKKHTQVSIRVDLMKKVKDFKNRMENLQIEMEKIKRFRPALQPDTSSGESWGRIEEKTASTEKVK